MVKRTFVLSSLALLLVSGGLASFPQKSPLEKSGRGILERAKVLLRDGTSPSLVQGVRLAQEGFLVSLLPELKALRSRSLSLSVRVQLTTAISALEHYKHMAVPPPRVDSLGSSLSKGVNPPLHRVRFVCLNRRGLPLSRARVRAFCRDYDLFQPFDGYAICDSKGVTEMMLPEGRWSFVAGGAPHAKPTLILLSEIPIRASKTLLLFPAKTRSWMIQNHGGFVPETLTLRHRDYPQLSLSYEILGLKGELEASKGGLQAWVQGRSKNRKYVMPADAGLHFDSRGLLPLKVQFDRGKVGHVQVELRLGGNDPSPVFSLGIETSGVFLMLPKGSLDLGYRYRMQAIGEFRFGLRPYDLLRSQALFLGAPLRPWVWHLAYAKRYRGAAPYTFQVFFRDPQDRLLESFSAEKRGAQRKAVSVRIHKGGTPWLFVRRLRNFRADIRRRLLSSALDDLEYEILTPFPIVGNWQRGHHSTRFHTKHYSLTGPALLAPEIKHFIRAAEVLFEPIRSVALRRLPWLRGRIVIHPTMPRGVRAYSSVRGNSNFNSKDLMRCVRLEDALRRTPIMHEHLHTVGYKHSDFMDVAGFRLRKKLFPVGSRGHGREVGRKGRDYIQWFMGKSNKINKKALLRVLLSRFGGSAFDAYFQRRKDLGFLEAKGLTEEEARAVLFSRILGRDMFSWFGVSPKRTKFLEELIQPKASEEVPAAITGPSAQDLVTMMDRLLRKKSHPKALGLRNRGLQTVLRKVGQLPSQRLRIRTALRLGAKAHGVGRMEWAYRCFRLALQEAARMDLKLFMKTRNAAVNVCMGNPLSLGWL